MKWRCKILRWGPWCGIIVPGIDALVNGVVAAVQPNYNPLGDYISDLSAPTVPYSGWIRGWWIVFPFIFAPFALSVFWHLRKGPARWGPLVLFLLFATALCFCGIFHCDPDCRGLTTSAHAHFISSYVTAAALYLSPLGMVIASWNDERWHSFQWANIGCLVLGGAVGLLLFLSMRGFLPGRGLLERVYFGVFYIWVILIALRLLVWDHGLAGVSLGRA